MFKKKHIILSNNEDLCLSVGFFILPISLLMGSAVINTIICLIDLFFLYLILKKKFFYFLNNKFFFNLFFFTIYLIIISLIFSIDKESSFVRSIGLIRFILLAFAVKFYFEHSLKNHVVLKGWLIIFLIVSFDLVFEIIFGHNTLGFKSRLPYRLASFVNGELKIGHFYFGFALIAYYTILKYYNKLNVQLLVFFTIIFISFFIGERSNFIKLLLSISIFHYIFFNFKIINFFKIILFLILPIIIFISFQSSYFDRYYTKIIEPIYKIGFAKYLKQTQYGAHYYSAMEIYNDNKFFGSGPRTFRIICANKKYYNKDLKFSSGRCSTHPHQLHFEFLSETGLIGYLAFLYVFIISIIEAIKNNIKKPSPLRVSGILVVATSLLPLIPSGSFFSTYGSAIFWVNFGLMMIKYEKK